MRRIALWFLSTLTVVVLLFGYHTSTSSSLAADAPPVVISSPAPSSDATTDTTTDTTTGGSTDSTSGSSSSNSSKKASSSPTASASPTSTTATYTGDVAQTRYGPLQVSITVTNGTITSVSVPEYPTQDPRDAQINSYALPVLVQETTQAQSSSIDMVSGATFTSEGYLQSLQSALDQAGL